MDSSLSNKRMAAEGTPDREALARSKVAAVTPVTKDLLSEMSNHASTVKQDINPATMAAFRAILREELGDMEAKLTTNFEGTLGQLRADLQAEQHARERLEQRVSQLEAGAPPSAQADDVDKTVAVIGGFGEMDPTTAESEIQDMLRNVDGFSGVYTTSPTPTVVFAQFTSPEKVLKFIRTQKAHRHLQDRKLWASENKSPSERKRGKIASKIKKFLIEIDAYNPRDIMVNYRNFKVTVRVQGFLAQDIAAQGEGVA